MKAIIKRGKKRGSTISIGTMLFESDDIGFYRLRTFDEMIGCVKCAAIYHKDTRYGPIIEQKGKSYTPIGVKGKIRHDKSSCKKYHIFGSKRQLSMTFESGPFTKRKSKGSFKVW